MVSATRRIEAIAQKLASSRYRFLTNVQIGTLRRLHKASRDEIRAAAIMADRLRRQEQVGQMSPSFTVKAIVTPCAPIVLPEEKRTKGRM